MPRRRKKAAPIHPGQTVSVAFASILRHNLTYVGEWEAAARNWDDIEGVHQVRVSLRRMRSALGVFRSAVPRSLTADWSEEMRWAAGELGPARDLDVFIDEGLGATAGRLPLPGEEKLLALATRHRETAYERVRTMLDSQRFARFRRSFTQWLDQAKWERAELDPKVRRRLASPLVPFARKRLDKQERKVLDVGTHVDPNSAAQMHQLRIECKKLRYATEFFTPLFEGMEPFIGHMKGLQDLLGIMNDVAVMHGLVDKLLEGVEDHEVLEYAGGLVGWRACHSEQIKDSFDERWEELVHAKHPWWKKSLSSHRTRRGEA
jgi:CHAD domain-containing protein